jgi:hypothetical protein
MKSTLLRLAISIQLILLLVSCNLPENGTPSLDDVIATRVALTLSLQPPSLQTGTSTSPALTQPIVSTVSTQQVTGTPTITPTKTPQKSPTGTLNPSNTPLPVPGSISGNISNYPYGSVPSLLIVASGLEPPYNYAYLITNSGSTFYSMSSDYLLPGHFQVVAYDSSDHRGGCTIDVLVISKQTVTCNITDWGGGYPAKPSGVSGP